MISPFETPQEFLEVEGPLYTFANSPIWIGVFLVLSTIIFLWFIVASYQTKGDESNSSNQTMMSLLLITSLLSVAESFYPSSVNMRYESNRRPSAEMVKAKRGWQLPAVLGMTAIAGTSRRRRKRSKSYLALPSLKRSRRMKKTRRHY